MSIGTGEAEANSRPGSTPDDDGEDEHPEPEAIYKRERDMESSPSESTTLSGDATSPVVEPKRAASGAGLQAEPGANTGIHPQQQQERDGLTPKDKDELDISERVRCYITKRKEEVKEHIKVVFADKLNTYEAIKRHNFRDMAVSNILGGLAIDQHMESDLFAGGDGRVCKTILRADFGAK